MQESLDRALGPEAPRVLPVVAAAGSERDASGTLGFRRKVHFVFTPGADGRLALGHYARGGQRVVAVDECPVHAAEGNDVAWEILRVCQEVGLPPASRDGRRGVLRHVVIRVSRATGEALATLVVTDARDRRLKRVTAALVARVPRLAGLHVNVLEGVSPWLFGPDTSKVHGRAFLKEDVAGQSYLIGPTAFFQTNVDAAEILVRLVLDAIPENTREAIDLYSGVGLFAFPMARRGLRVTAVEESAEAVAAARRSQALNGIDDQQCRFVHARVEDAVARLGNRGLTAGGTRRSPVVVLDPPRSGCHPSVLRALARDLAPQTIVYVSCEPAALARDLAELRDVARQHGVAYDVARVQPVDMFPHTSHVEAVAVIRQPAARPPA